MAGNPMSPKATTPQTPASSREESLILDLLAEAVEFGRPPTIQTGKGDIGAERDRHRPHHELEILQEDGTEEAKRFGCGVERKREIRSVKAISKGNGETDILDA
ncbi:hypothetical protein BHE74_00011849 [Ensete ventricosum]|uniref:Uncharacterized protein n=1 Tax=Ensete ventricosum TaxID=4639 RepID=A0A426Z0P9_ENSVE|nr:hypothetical protein B296_00047189 [Ensete ventricosum]RWW79850.1 hypothetical protein BHE74_00011849 [Ensete ventricosum]